MEHVMSLRKALALVRSPTTGPSTLIDSGQTASAFAFEYIKNTKIKKQKTAGAPDELNISDVTVRDGVVVNGGTG